MRLTTVAPLAILFATAAASAAPVFWYSNPGPINSRGLLGSATNSVVTLPATPLSTNIQYLTISGNLTSAVGGTHSSEACIEVSTPNGTFVLQPFSGGTFSGTIPVPAGAMTVSPYLGFGIGPCQLRFFELYADNAAGPDAVWTNLSVTLHDLSGGDVQPMNRDIAPTVAGPDVATGESYVYRNFPTTAALNFPTERVAGRFRIKGYGTAMTGWNANLSTTPLHSVNVAITAPGVDGNDVTWNFTPYDIHAASSSDFDLTFTAPQPVLAGPTHQWTYVLTDNGVPVPLNNRFACIWFSVQPLTGDAPAATDLGVIRGNPILGPAESTVVNNQSFFTFGHQIHWFTFTTEQACSDATGYWLDIHSQAPVNSSILDHEMALYDTNGLLQASNDDGGSNHLSMLTFGDSSPVRAPVDPNGAPAPRNGSNGTLAAGQHYLAVAEYDTTFAGSGWYATSTGTHGSTINFEFRTNLPALPCGPADVGSAGGVAGADGLLDNNDFIVFINNFFAQAPSADVGIQGGLPGADGQWDNNDFIVFINQFFGGCI